MARDNLAWDDPDRPIVPGSPRSMESNPLRVLKSRGAVPLSRAADS